MRLCKGREKLARISNPWDWPVPLCCCGGWEGEFSVFFSLEVGRQTAFWEEWDGCGTVGRWSWAL